MNRIININCLSCICDIGYILNVEIILSNGYGKIFYKGFLGKDLLNSIKLAFNIIKFKFKNKIFIKNYNIYINISPNKLKKRGPCLGLPILIALLSIFYKINIKSNIAITGELDINGNILPVGCIKSKFNLIYKKNIKLIIMPQKNIISLLYIPKYIKNFINIVLVKNLKEIINLLNLNI